MMLGAGFVIRSFELLEHIELLFALADTLCFCNKVLPADAVAFGERRNTICLAMLIDARFVEQLFLQCDHLLLVPFPSLFRFLAVLDQPGVLNRHLRINAFFLRLHDHMTEVDGIKVVKCDRALL